MNSSFKHSGLLYQCNCFLLNDPFSCTTKTCLRYYNDMQNERTRPTCHQLHSTALIAKLDCTVIALSESAENQSIPLLTQETAHFQAHCC